MPDLKNMQNCNTDFSSGFFAAGAIKKSSNLQLFNFPEKMNGDFLCSTNNLTSLKGSPQEHVTGNFHCNANNLTSLEYSPIQVDGHYNCHHNRLSSLKGISSKIGESVSAYHCGLTSLKDIHNYFKGGYLRGTLCVSYNPICESILGALLVSELQDVQYFPRSDFIKHQQSKRAFEIINKHLKTEERDVLLCQRELIQAGLKEYAKL